nr:hypothetical protein [Mycoplasmopsis columboralis]
MLNPTEESENVEKQTNKKVSSKVKKQLNQVQKMLFENLDDELDIDEEDEK